MVVYRFFLSGMLAMATIKDVAELAKVSRTTVSRVLGGNSYVNAATKKRVLEAIENLDYTPSAIAMSLKAKRSKSVAVVVPNMRNQIFVMIVRGAEDEARKRGYMVVLCNTNESEEVERRYVEKLQDNWVDGFVFATGRTDPTCLRALREKNIPAVVTVRTSGSSVDMVGIDNYQASRTAVGYLLKTGHKRIAIVNRPRSIPLYRERFFGYADAIHDAGGRIEERLVIEETDYAGNVYSKMLQLLQSGTVPDAVFATSDMRAIHAMRAILDFGLKIPGDISLVGMDNIKISSLIEPPLTTVSLPLYEMGGIAMARLIHQIENGMPDFASVELLPTTLIVRKSTRYSAL